MVSRHSTFALAALPLLLAPAAAQTPLLVIKSTPQQMPADMAAVGDWNGDGTGDIAVGNPDPFQGSAGMVRILSGHDGSVLATFTGTFPQQAFGALVAGVGDVDGDGAVDVAVGTEPAPSSLLPTSVHVLGATGGTLFEHTFGFMGLYGLGGVGDADGDGHPDLVTGGFDCPGGALGTGNPGNATLWSAATGTVLHAWCGDGPGDHFGQQVSRAGDVNADGYADVIVGASEQDDFSAEGVGYVRALSGLDGSTLFTLESPNENSGFGEAIDAAGDVDGDGHGDVLVGVRQEMNGATFLGAAHVYSGLDGSLLHHVPGVYAYEQFGFEVAGPGDISGDGLADFVVATSDVLQSGGLPGYEVYSGPDAGLLEAVPIAPPATFGVSLRAAGDLQGDGIPDLLVLSLQGTPSLGVLEVRSGAPVLFADLGFALAGSAGAPRLQVEGVLAKGLPIALDVSRAPPLAPLFLVLGLAATPQPFKAGVLVPAPQLVLGGLATGSAGEFSLEATVAGGLPANLEVVLQGWMPDAGGPAGFVATNAVLGVAP